MATLFAIPTGYLCYRTGLGGAEGGAVIGLMAGLGMLIGQSQERETINRTKAGLPDIGDSILWRFADSTRANHPEMPSVTILEKPVIAEYDLLGLAPSIEFVVSDLRLTEADGLSIEVMTTVRRQGGFVVWQHRTSYRSSAIGRKSSVREYKAEHFKVLKEEMNSATTSIVADILRSLAR